MNEQQSAVHTRAQQTCAVWNQHAPTLEFGDLKLADHQALTASIPTLEQAILTQEDAANFAKGAVFMNLAYLEDINARFVKAVEGGCKKGDPCLNELADLRKIKQNSRKKVLDRAPMTISLWTKVNANRAAATPAVAALKVGTATLAEFTAKRNGHEALVQAATNEESALKDRRQQFEAAIAELNIGNQRWLDGWTAEFPEGTPERAALSQITIPSNATPVPGQAVITALNVFPGRIVDLHFAAPHGTRFKIEFKPQASASFTVLAEDWDGETFQHPVGTPGTYIYVVTPRNSSGMGPASAPGQIVVP